VSEAGDHPVVTGRRPVDSRHHYPLFLTGQSVNSYPVITYKKMGKGDHGGEG
jgi:hypothetical protein